MSSSFLNRGRLSAALVAAVGLPMVSHAGPNVILMISDGASVGAWDMSSL